MKQRIFIGVTIALALGGGIWWWASSRTRAPADITISEGLPPHATNTETAVSQPTPTSATPSPATTPPTPTNTSTTSPAPEPSKSAAVEIVWGMNMLSIPYPYESRGQALTELRPMWDTQISTLKRAGVTMVRLGGHTQHFTYLDELIPKFTQAGIRVLLVLEDLEVSADDADEYAHGYAFGKEVVGRYRDAIDDYQLANEIGGYPIKGPQYHGISIDDYDPHRLDRQLGFIKGARQAIRELDAGAKAVVVINSVHTGIIQEAIKRGIDFDIIGWNWFSDFGTNLQAKVLNEQTGETFAFLETMKSFGKPLWVTEANRREGIEQVGAAAQAAFIDEAAEIAIESGFTGFFPYLIVDAVGIQEGGRSYGFFDSKKKTDGLWTLAEPRQTMTDYPSTIQRLSDTVATDE